MDHSHHHTGHEHHQHHAEPTVKKATSEHVHSTGAEPDRHMHDKHAGHHTEDFLKRFWICLSLTVPVLLLSEMIQHWFGFHISFPGDKYVLLLLGTLIYFYGGMPFLKGMASEIRYKAMGMMTLVALAISVAYIYNL
jgi:P-type Cu2+ transporter